MIDEERVHVDLCVGEDGQIERIVRIDEKENSYTEGEMGNRSS